VILHDFQQDADARIQSAWDAGAQNVMAVMPTGSGKTVLFCHIVKRLNVPTRLMAHRQELVSQISLTLNRDEIKHSITAPKDVITQIVRAHVDLHGRSHYAVNSQVRVESVDTVAKREGKQDENVRLVIIDEGHHVLSDNKWGTALARYRNARGLLVTAHACRADGLGLGRTGNGVVDTLVVGPCGRDLIRRGFLTDYRVFCPPDDIDIQGVEISNATGDYNQVQLRDRVHKSRGLVGSVVEHYLRVAAGKLGITFAVDIEEAKKLCNAYRAAGVIAELITAKTDVRHRSEIMRRFRAREVQQLVSVDVLGEGVDVPAIEVVSFARHTASWQLMCQQFGRALRVSVAEEYARLWGGYTDEKRKQIIEASNKPRAIVLDHVGNIARHYVHRGLPDSPQSYSLATVSRAALRKQPDDAIPLFVCIACLQPYESFRSVCPWCKAPRPAPQSRSSVEAVEGNLLELDPVALDERYREIARVDGPANARGFDAAANAIRKLHGQRQEAQKPLRDLIALWAGHQRHLGMDEAESYRLFWRKYGYDVAQAMTLGTNDAYKLYARLAIDLNNVRKL